MKVLFVCDHVFLTKEGKVYANSFSYRVLKRYVDVFSQVTVIARHRKADEDEQIDLPLASGEGISFVFLESISSISSFLGLRQRHAKQIEKIVQVHDGVIARVPSELGLMTAKAAENIKKPYMLEMVGCAWDALWNLGGWKAKAYAPLLYVKTRHAVGRSPYVTYVTGQFLQKRYPFAPGAQAIGVSDVQLTKVDEKTLTKRIRKIEAMGSKRVYGTIGNLYVGYKGIGVAIKALAEVEHPLDDFEYHILGAGDSSTYRAMAENLASEIKCFLMGCCLKEKLSMHGWTDWMSIFSPVFRKVCQEHLWKR